MSRADLSSRFAALTRVLGLSAVALLLFGLTTLVPAALLAVIRDSSILEPGNWSAGILCTLIAFLFILSFHVRKETLTLHFADQDTFVEQLSAALMERGYEVEQPDAHRLLGKPSFAALLFGGTVHVQLQGDSARLFGPKITVDGLRTRLRVQSHLEGSRRTLADSGHYVDQGRLRSVQIQFSTQGEQNPNLTHELVQTLTRIGAIVHCDIGVWAQNDAGMEEILIEKLVRDKLKRKGIAVTVHKKPLAPSNQEDQAAIA